MMSQSEQQQHLRRLWPLMRDNLARLRRFKQLDRELHAQRANALQAALQLKRSLRLAEDERMRRARLLAAAQAQASSRPPSKQTGKSSSRHKRKTRSCSQADASTVKPELDNSVQGASELAVTVSGSTCCSGSDVSSSSSCEEDEVVLPAPPGHAYCHIHTGRLPLPTVTITLDAASPRDEQRSSNSRPSSPPHHSHHSSPRHCGTHTLQGQLLETAPPGTPPPAQPSQEQGPQAPITPELCEGTAAGRNLSGSCGSTAGQRSPPSSPTTVDPHTTGIHNSSRSSRVDRSSREHSSSRADSISAQAAESLMDACAERWFGGGGSDTSGFGGGGMTHQHTPHNQHWCSGSKHTSCGRPSGFIDMPYNQGA